MKDIQVTRGAPLISHMFFPNDTYIYCKANGETSFRILEMLNIFECASGQKINVAKSSIFYNRNTDAHIKHKVHSVLGFNEVDEGTLYLGLPNIMECKKSAVLGYLKNILCARIQGCEKLLLSNRGKEVLLKMVA